MTHIDLPVNRKGRTRSGGNSTSNICIDTFQQSFRFRNFDETSQHDGTKLIRTRAICPNGLIATVHEAFANERELVFSPDVIWTAILQQVALHIDKNAEALREKFVSHKGRETIRVRHDVDSWLEVFPKFSAVLQEKIVNKDFFENTTGDFSTSGINEQVVRTISLMESMQSYFQYEVMTMCGIPRITLTGTAKDWYNLMARADAICQETEMTKWAGELMPVLYQFSVLATDPSKASADFWSRIYKYHGPEESGSLSSCTGWINVFFPSMFDRVSTVETKDQEKFANWIVDANWWESNVADNYLCGATSSHTRYTSGVSAVDFKWLIGGNEVPMTFCGGFLSAIGIVEGEDGRPRDAVTPVLA